MRQIILASSSPRRKGLLEQIGLKFAVESRVEEDNGQNGLPPEKLVEQNSLKKAHSAAAFHQDAIIIAADTIGNIDGKIIGKPVSADEARAMLSSLSGKTHKVITGFTVLDTASKKVVTKSVSTTVYFKKLSTQEIDDYVDTGEPLDKAGAYGVQGKGALLVEKIEGDYFNVVGLPLFTLGEVLKEFSVEVF